MRPKSACILERGVTKRFDENGIESAHFMNAARDGLVALAVWLGVAFSVGWYYTITYYGHTGIPVPTPESCAAIILYYFSVINADTEIQAIHWMVVFPIAGALWAAALIRLVPRFGGTCPAWWRTLRKLALCSLPLAIPGPWLMYIAGTTDQGFHWDRAIAVALRRGNISPWPGLNLLYVSLGVAVLVLQFIAYRRIIALRGGQAWRHTAAAGIVLVVAAALIGAIAVIPLRALLE